MGNKTGGPAFPWCGDLNECPTINLGMTLRDYFAAKAMHALIQEGYFDTVAKMSYEMADVMLKERKA